MTNAAGHKYHNWYGFGAIDVGDAILAATNYSKDLGTFVDTGMVEKNLSSNMSIPSLSTNQTSLVINKPSGSNGKVEFINVRIWLYHTKPQDVGMRLTSPSGLRVNIIQPYTKMENNPYTSSGWRYFDIGVNAFYGENMSGTWTLSVEEYTSDDVDGELGDWGLQIYGN